MGFPGGLKPGTFRPVLVSPSSTSWTPSCPLLPPSPSEPCLATCTSTRVCVGGYVLQDRVCTRRQVTLLDTRKPQGQGDVLPPTPAKAAERSQSQSPPLGVCGREFFVAGEAPAASVPSLPPATPQQPLPTKPQPAALCLVPTCPHPEG